MRKWIIVAAFGLAAFVPGSAFAQQDARSLSLIMLLQNADVQKELTLSDKEKASLALMEKENAEASRKLRYETRRLSREDFPKRREFVKETEKQVLVLIGEKKYGRLRQIQNQVLGISMAVVGTEIATKLGVTDEQKAKLVKLRNGATLELRGIMLADKSNDGRDPDARRKPMEEFRGRQDAKVMEVLTDGQKAKWKELIGTPIAYKFTQD